MEQKAPSLLFQNQEPSLGSQKVAAVPERRTITWISWSKRDIEYRMCSWKIMENQQVPGGGRGRRNCPKRRRHRLEHQPPCNCSSKRARRKNRRSVTGRRRRRRFFFIFLYFSISFFVFYFCFVFFFLVFVTSLLLLLLIFLHLRRLVQFRLGCCDWLPDLHV